VEDGGQYWAVVDHLWTTNTPKRVRERERREKEREGEREATVQPASRQEEPKNDNKHAAGPGAAASSLSLLAWANGVEAKDKKRGAPTTRFLFLVSVPIHLLC